MNIDDNNQPEFDYFTVIDATILKHFSDDVKDSPKSTLTRNGYDVEMLLTYHFEDAELEMLLNDNFKEFLDLHIDWLQDGLNENTIDEYTYTETLKDLKNSEEWYNKFKSEHFEELNAII